MVLAEERGGLTAIESDLKGVKNELPQALSWESRSSFSEEVAPRLPVQAGHSAHESGNVHRQTLVD